jgi:hypothetical protein
MSAVANVVRGGAFCLAILLGIEGACLAGTAELAGGAALSDANPYLVIVARNVFRLNSPPLPAKTDQTPALVLPMVDLSGFIQTGEQVQALLAVTVQNPDPHGHDLTSYLTLAEGDKETVGSGAKKAVVELVRAYANEEKVDIINAGTPVTLSMKGNAFDGVTNAPRRHTGAAAFRFAGDDTTPPVAGVATETAPMSRAISRGSRSTLFGGAPSDGLVSSADGSGANNVAQMAAASGRSGGSVAFRFDGGETPPPATLPATGSAPVTAENSGNDGAESDGPGSSVDLDNSLKIRVINVNGGKGTVVLESQPP